MLLVLPEQEEVSAETVSLEPMFLMGTRRGESITFPLSPPPPVGTLPSAVAPTTALR